MKQAITLTESQFELLRKIDANPEEVLSGPEWESWEILHNDGLLWISYFSGLMLTDIGKPALAAHTCPCGSYKDHGESHCSDKCLETENAEEGA